MIIWTGNKIYYKVDYSNENDLEKAISHVKTELFGKGRIYLPVKKKIGKKIPDGYLIDLGGNKARLYVVEVEMARHELLRHIAVQLIEFSLAFEESPNTVKRILLEAIHSQSEAKEICEDYSSSKGYRNLDHFFEEMVMEGEFAVLIIIDEIPEDFERALIKQFQFGIEVLELSCYEDNKGERIYHFEPFLADVTEDVGITTVRPINVGEIDTIVVPSREDGLKVFLEENRWYAIRIHGTMRPQIKYIALYQVDPVSAVTHIASVRSIEPWKDTDKFVVNFAEPAKQIGPISLIKGKGHRAKRYPQGPRYASYKRLKAAKNLGEVW